MANPTSLQILLETSLPAAIQTEIEKLILVGELCPGQRINEALLAERFHTSRGPVREALRALEECGLVRAERNRGSFVRSVSLGEADEIYDLREVLDEFVGRKLAECILAEQLTQLRSFLAEMDVAVARKDLTGYHQINLRFHETLVDFVGNSRLSATYRRLTKELLMYRLHGLKEGGGFSVSNAEHKTIVKAIASRDPERAGRALRTHASDSRTRMHRAAIAAGSRVAR
ncbi:MAG: phosphonate utilization associated transcriptional regulator [Proteobacteria bacterium]|nr:phosphonate utilization associated transcriptional regulator [Pseudomonadota bacterium]